MRGTLLAILLAGGIGLAGTAAVSAAPVINGSAIGNAASTDVDPAGVSFWLDDVLVVDRGGRAASYREEDGQRVMKQDEIGVRVELGRGKAAATVWTCDFSHEYVSINADYRS